MLLFALGVLLRFWEFSRIIRLLLYDLNFADESVGLPYNPRDPCCFFVVVPLTYRYCSTIPVTLICLVI